MSKQITDFLKAFGNVIVCTSDSSKQNSGFKPTTLLSALYLNTIGHDVYFYPNLGGSKSQDITTLTCCFIDLDAGRDAKGKYLKPSLVQYKKNKMILAINQCKLKPTFVVETRNGYQVYWCFKKLDISYLDSWKRTQNQIYNHFKAYGADSRVLKVNQLLRLPYTKWNKKYEGVKDTFDTKIYQANKTNYNFTDVQSAFNDLPIKVTKGASPSYQNKAKKPDVTAAVNIFDTEDGKPYTVTKTPQVNQSQNKIIYDVIDLLEELTPILKYSNHKFLSNQAQNYVAALHLFITNQGK